MLINLGRLLMLCVWAFLLLNIFQPFPRPLNIFVNVALIFMVLMHGMQLALLKSTMPKDGPQMTNGEKIRIFLFTVVIRRPADLSVLEYLYWLLFSAGVSPARKSLRSGCNRCQTSGLDARIKHS